MCTQPTLSDYKGRAFSICTIMFIPMLFILCTYIVIYSFPWTIKIEDTHNLIPIDLQFVNVK